MPILDNSAFSIKSLTGVGLAGVFILSVLYIFNNFSEHNRILICAEKEKFTVIGRLNSGFDVVFSSASTKNLLDCIGRIIPFYDRRIELFFQTGSNLSSKEELIKRYNVVRFTDGKIMDIALTKLIVDQTEILLLGKENILIVSQSTRSPFDIIKKMNKYDIDRLIIPDMNRTIYEIYLNYFKGQEHKIKIVKNDSRYLLNL